MLLGIYLVITKTSPLIINQTNLVDQDTWFVHGSDCLQSIAAAAEPQGLGKAKDFVDDSSASRPLQSV